MQTISSINFSGPNDSRSSVASPKTLSSLGSKTASGGKSGQDVVELSIFAQVTLAESKAAPNYYAQFMPVRQGFSNAAISNTVENPGAESSSAGKSLSEVAKIARQMMDNTYAAMKESGKPFDINSPGGVDANTLVGNLDRRTLYAIKTNQDGLFTKEERMVADVVMFNQEALAAGLYSGPIELTGKFQDRFGENHVARSNFFAKWLDKVSDDEKSSPAWGYMRASAQLGSQELNAKKKSPLEIKNPLAQLIYEAMAAAERNDPDSLRTTGRVDSYQDLLNQPWFKGYEERLKSLGREA